MPTTTLMPLPKQQFQTVLGTPLVGGKVFTYAAGGTDPKATYTDAAGTTEQPNPIVLNLRGEPPAAIYWSGNYRVELRDSLNNLIYTVDNFNTDPAGVWGGASALLATLAGAAGASLIGWIQAGANAVVRLIRDKLRETVSLEDFGAGVAGTSDAVAWQRAADYCQGSSRNIELQRKYSIDADITLAPGISVLGKSRLTTGLEFSGTASLTMAGSPGTKNAGNMSFSRMLISHTSTGVVLKMSEFKYITFFDVEFYNGSITGYIFSYMTFLKCIGFDFSMTMANAVNALNEAFKVIGCNFSSVPLIITNTTDVVVSDTHFLGPDSQISVSRGAMPPGFYALVAITNTVVDSTKNEGVTLTGCTPRIASSFFSAGRTNSKPGIFLYDCYEGSISGSTARFCGSHGIQLDSCFGVDVSGNSLTDNQQMGAQMVSCDQISYRGNLLGNTPGWYGGSYVQQYGIVDSAGNCTNTIVDGNKFVGNAVGAVYLPNASIQYGVNTGLLRTNYGTANVNTVAGIANIAHGLNALPRYAAAITVSGADLDTQITAVDATNITIRTRTSTTNANLSGSYAILWEAKL